MAAPPKTFRRWYLHMSHKTIIYRCFGVGWEERSCGQQDSLHDVPAKVLRVYNLIHIILALVNEYRRFLSQFSTNFHESLHTLFSIYVV